MKIDFEYGQGTMAANLPDNTDIFIPGETVKDPDYIPEDKLEEAYLESLAHPIGMPTLTELAHKGSTVTIIVPDRVKGGEQATSHRKLSIKYILKELYAAGVEKKDILFIISNGLHPRSKESDAKAIFGDELFNEFWHTDGMGTNPMMMMQALSAQVLRFKRVMSDNCVIICASTCNGYFHDELWPYLRELYTMFQHDHMNTLPDMNRYGEYFATNEEYIRKYRFCNAFHPFHGFSMMSCGHIAEMNTSAIYIVGAEEPGYARGMGLKTRATFEEALEDAKKKFVGNNPNILALPMTFKKAAVHLCMKNPDDDCMDEYGHRHGGCGCC